MVFWIVFLLIELSLLGICRWYCENKKSKYICLFLVTIIAIYFAGFRDGLGMDYDAYRDNCERYVYISDNWILSEPLYELIRSFCYETNYSAVIYFLSSAIITYTLCFYVYSQLKEYEFAILVFLIYSGLYIFSFNISRQFIAASLCLLALTIWIRDRKIWQSILLIIIGCLFHKSSIFFIPCFFIGAENIKGKLWSLLVLISFIFPTEILLNSTRISDALTLLNYTTYLDYDSHAIAKTSISNIYMHIIFAILMFNLDQIREIGDKILLISIKMFALFLVFSNLSAGGFSICYRVAVLFAVFIPIAFTIFPRLFSREFVLMTIIIPCFILLIINLMNENMLPERMLPLDSIFDSIYVRY